MPTVFINHDLPLAPEIRGERPDLTVLDAADHADPIAAAPDAEIIVSNAAEWDDVLLESLSAGDWVQTTSAGYDGFPVDRLAELGVRLTNATGNYGPVVAEHAFALALAFSRMIPTFVDKQQRHQWGPRTEVSLEITDWRDRTLTVYGLGNIGEAIAERGLAFDMNVYGIKRNPADYDGVLSKDRVIPTADFERVLPETDLLVAIVPLTPETEGSIDAAVFDAVPDSAILVNVARGPVVDTDDLISALENDRIAAAGLDVFDQEPLPADSPLWDRDDVIITPHVGGRSNTFPDRFADLFLDNYDRWRRDEPLINEVIS